jgi:DNA polymerase I-like protein with 3'-5' exonuclease and polymerase domains
VIGEQMLRISKRYKVALTVHDAVMAIVNEEERDDAIRYVAECMSWRPKWAQTLPLACEIGAGKNYSDCSDKKSLESWGL